MKLTVKLLNLQDILQYKRIYFEILGNLADAPLLDANSIGEIYRKATLGGSHFVGCFDSGDELIGVATIFIDHKFIRGGVSAAHIEELVTRKGYEGRGVGSLLLKFCIETAEKLGCYKVILDCDEKIIPFYEKNGFKKHGAFMRKGIL